MKTEREIREYPVEFAFALKTGRGQNSREHWAARARRVKSERSVTSGAFLAATRPQARGDLRLAARFAPGLSVTLTRTSPASATGWKPLDSDNLSGSLKAVRDQIAAELAADDGSPMLEWRYRQEEGEWGVRVRIERPADELEAALAEQEAEHG